VQEASAYNDLEKQMLVQFRKFNFRQLSKCLDQDIASYLTISTIWIVMITLVNPIGEFPLNDDWVYALAVKSVLETGYYQFPSPSSANVGPQVYWGALFCFLFGFSFTALRFSTLILGLIGILVLYQLIRELGNDQKTALLCALTLAVNPIYFGLANSFMTEIPFISLVTISSYYLMRGLQSNASFHIALGLAFSFAAILVRQLGVLILVGFAFAYPVKYGFRLKNILKASLPFILGILLHVAYQYWMVNSGRTPLLMVHSDISKLPSSSISTWAMREFAINAFVYLGFFLIPVLILFIQQTPNGYTKKHLRVFLISLISFAAFILWLFLRKDNTLPSLTNVLIKSGIGPLTLRDTFILSLNNPSVPQVLSIFWGGMTVLSAIAASAFICYIWLATKQFVIEFKNHKSRSSTWKFLLPITMGGAYFSVLMFISSGYLSMFDRYLLPLIPIAILLLTNIKFQAILPRHNVGQVLSAAFIILYAAFSVAATHDYISWNRARWSAINNLLIDNKVSPNQIDGGYEFNGLFLYDPKYKNKEGKSWWWVNEDEYIITSGPLQGYTEYSRYPFSRWLTLSKSNIFILHKNRSF